MALKFTGRRYHDDPTGTVTFPAWNNQARVNCRITDEALMFMFGAERTDSGLLEAFDKYRAPIEVAAAWKFEALAAPMNITLASTDFPDRKPAGTGDLVEAAGRGGPSRIPEPSAPEKSTPAGSRAAAQEAADKVQQFRRQTQAVASAHAVSDDIAAWNAETAKVLGKLDADTLTEPAEEEKEADKA